MKKVLFTATIDGHITQFHMNYIRWFQSKGYEVHVASNGSEVMQGVDKKYNIPFSRQPVKVESWEAYRALKKIVHDNDYEIVHCHTPMGAVLTRLATRDLRKEGVKVLYTAHGFHFYKGSSVTNWVLYYPVEKILSRYTDCLITINPEDFNIAKDRKFKAMDIRYVHGVGVDTTKFHPVPYDRKRKLRLLNGIKEDAFVLTTVGELSFRKNQDMIINTMNSLIKEIPEAVLLIVGVGGREAEYKKLVEEYALEHAVKFLGYRSDIDELMQLTDVAVSCSKQEGLPVNLMEAMATGLPLVATNCRGNRDLVLSYLNGFKVELNDEMALAKYISLLAEHQLLRERFGKRSLSMIKEYSNNVTQTEMDTIYSYYIDQKIQEHGLKTIVPSKLRN